MIILFESLNWIEFNKIIFSHQWLWSWLLKIRVIVVEIKFGNAINNFSFSFPFPFPFTLVGSEVSVWINGFELNSINIVKLESIYTNTKCICIGRASERCSSSRNWPNFLIQPCKLLTETLEIHIHKKKKKFRVAYLYVWKSHLSNWWQFSYAN